MTYSRSHPLAPLLYCYIILLLGPCWYAWSRAESSIPAFPAFDQNFRSEDISLIGVHAYGVGTKLKTRGDTLFHGNGGYLEIIDFSNPADPRDIGKVVLPDLALDIELHGNFALIAANQKGLLIIDISNPAAPRQISDLPLPGVTRRLDVTETHAFLVNKADGLHVVDIQDPRNPVEVGCYIPNASSGFEDISVEGHHAFIARTEDHVSDGGLAVIDVADPTNPSWVTGCWIGSSCWSIGMGEGLACLCGRPSALGPWDLRIVDVSDPASPGLLSTFGSSSSLCDVVIKNHHIYAANSGKGLAIIDINDPMDPQLVKQVDIPWPEMAYYIALSDNYVFLGASGIFAIEVNDDDDAEIVGRYDWICRSVRDLIAQDGLLYANDWLAFDIGDPRTPEYVGRRDLDPYYVSLRYLQGHFACYSHSEFGVYDVSDPGNPVEVYVSELGLSAAAVQDSTLFAASDAGQFHVFDVRNPQRPIALSHIPAADYRDLEAGQGYVFLVGPELSVVDVGDPLAPRLVTRLDIMGGCDSAALSGNYLYITAWHGLTVFDVSNPESPEMISVLEVGDPLGDIEIRNRFAYLADPQAGLLVIDISDPFNPYEVATIQITDGAEDIALYEDLVCVAADRAGLWIFRHSIATPNQLALFTAKRTDNCVLVQWQLSAQTPLVGFKVYRGAPGHSPSCLATEPRHGQLQYEITDCQPFPGESFYLLAGLERDGTETWLGRAPLARQDDDLSPPWLFLDGPNPFNPRTEFTFVLPATGKVRLSICDLAGRLVSTLVDDVLPRGQHVAPWAGLDDRGHQVAAGIYLVHLMTESGQSTQKITLIK